VKSSGSCCRCRAENEWPTFGDHLPFAEENRRRAAAAASNSEVASPDGAERVWFPRNRQGLSDRLGYEDLVVWADVDHHDVLHVLWRGDSNCPMLSGGIQGLPLWPVVGLPNVWEVSIRITSLVAALVSVDVLIDDHVPAGSRVFRGELRGEVAKVDRLANPLIETSIASIYFDVPRPISLYRHPKWTNANAVVIVADGGNVRGFAPYVEAAIDAGTIAPVALIGIHSSEDRHLEYLSPEFWEQLTAFPDSEKRRAARAFDQHMSFVLTDVFAWIQRELGLVHPASRFVQGNSNGAAWALTACQRHPEAFAGAIGFSVAGGMPQLVELNPNHRYVLAAGTLEPFHKTTYEWAGKLGAAGNRVHRSEHINGHDWQFWAEQFAVALATLA
jgi:predicted esterase